MRVSYPEYFLSVANRTGQSRGPKAIKSSAFSAILRPAGGSAVALCANFRLDGIFKTVIKFQMYMQLCGSTNTSVWVGCACVKAEMQAAHANRFGRH